MDAGRTWQSLAIFGGYVEFAVHPQNGAIVYFFNGGVFFRSDQGGRFPKRLSAVSTNRQSLDLTIDPRNGSVLYATVSNEVYKTTDGGLHWNPTACRCKTERFMLDPADSRIVYAVGIDAKKSTDAGVSWVRLTPPTGSPGQPRVWINSIAAHPSMDPSNPEHLWTGSFVGLFVSYNGGESWWRFSTAGLKFAGDRYSMLILRDTMLLTTDSGIFRATAAH